MQIPLLVEPQSNPWIECAGMFKDDFWIEEWKQSMAEYRQKLEEDPDYP